MTTAGSGDLDDFAAWERRSWQVRAEAYGTSFVELTRGSVPALLDAARVAAGSRVLDVGTGPGEVARAAAARGASVHGVDHSAPMVAQARASGVVSVVAVVEHLPVRDGAYDAVVAGYLLNHLPRPEAAVAELARVLAPGGRLAFTVWDRPEANPALGAFGPVLAELDLVADVPAGPDAQRFADADEVSQLLAGWSDVVVAPVRWSVTVEPGAWFDAVADSTPRTGGALASAAPQQRAAARSRFVDVVLRDFPAADGLVELPAAAVLSSAVRPA